MERGELERALLGTLRVLREYLPDIMLIGGWVPYLWFRHGALGASRARTSLTMEADVLLPSTLPPKDRPPLARLLEAAGFGPLGESGVVWAREPARGETIELLRSHEGPALQTGRPTSVPEQPGIRALPLTHLWILMEHPRRLHLPDPDDAQDPLVIRVPSLAAFTLNKANTFSLRAGKDGELKAAKDILYLRDILAAGDGVVTSLEEDLGTMMNGGDADRTRRYLDRAVVHLERVAPRWAGAAAAVLAERDAMDAVAADADVRGHLTDLLELLTEVRA